MREAREFVGDISNVTLIDIETNGTIDPEEAIRRG